MKKSKTSVLRAIYASSEQSADLFYCAGVFVPDPFLSIVRGTKRMAIVNRLEFGRVQSQSKFDEVLLLETVKQQAAEYLKIAEKSIGPAELIRYFFSNSNADLVEVPGDFPSLYYAQLESQKIPVSVCEGAFFPSREKKTDDEANMIRQGNAASAAGIRIAEAVIKASKIKGKRLVFEGATLTSERLRTLIDQACLGKGAIAQNTIVAGGVQACDPHEGGYGPLRPNELIIIDVFPRIQKTGYHGDMTRTFLKGKASAAQRNLVSAVRGAQLAALKKIKAGVTGASVHGAAAATFQDRGYVTERRGDGFVGFIHSTGHGLGLEVHEAPRVSVGAPRLRVGQVITVEPGLYYPEIGGCRIEDVVRVTSEGSQRLSPMHYRWEIA